MLVLQRVLTPSRRGFNSRPTHCIAMEGQADWRRRRFRKPTGESLAGSTPVPSAALSWRGRPASVPGARLLNEWSHCGLRVRVPSSPPIRRLPYFLGVSQWQTPRLGTGKTEVRVLPPRPSSLIWAVRHKRYKADSRSPRSVRQYVSRHRRIQRTGAKLRQ